MSDCWFRLCVLLSRNNRIGSEQSELTLSIGAPFPDLSVRSVPIMPLVNAGTVEFIGRGYSTLGQAREAGLLLRRALLIGAAQWRVGIDLGFLKSPLDDDISEDDDSFPNPRVSEGIEHHTPSPRYGLSTYDKPPLERIVASDIRIVGHLPPDRLFASIRTVIANSVSPTQKQLLALELLAISHFESSYRARFLTMISIVEMLAEQRKRDDASLALVEGFIETTRAASLSLDSKKALLSALRNLQSQSIASACGELVELRLGTESAEKFKRYYVTKNKLIHRGVSPDNDSLTRELIELESLARSLILRDISGKIA